MSTSVQTTTNYLSSSSSSTSTSTTTKNDIGKDAFMKMLIAQLQNQDPLNPMDGTEFAVQLAQFSSLEQLQNLNTTMSSLPDYLGSFTNAQVANLIGDEATATGNVIAVNGSSTKINYNLPSDIAGGTISIYNSNGLLVDTISVGSQKTGVQSVTWNSDGQNTGNYTYEISAKDSSGNAVTVDSYLTGTVTGVSYKDNLSYLVINGKEVAFTDVLKINKTSN